MFRIRAHWSAELASAHRPTASEMAHAGRLEPGTREKKAIELFP